MSNACRCGWLTFLCFSVSVATVGVATVPVSAKGYRWNCQYEKMATQDGVKSEQFKMEFAFDDATNKAIMIGNNGFSDVDFHGGSYGVTFLEKLSTGAVQSTTVTNEGASVHSRHSMLGSKLITSQYYGRCSFKQ